MSKALQKKIREVEEQHAEETLNNHLEKHDQKKTAQALFLLGGITAADRIAKNISSQVMGALIEAQKNDVHEQFGFTRFAEFLDQSEYSPMSKTDFYRRKELYDAEGSELYDAFNEMKIPMSTRRLIAQNGEVEITIEGNELKIGEERADLSDLPLIKEILKRMSAANQKFAENKKTQDTKLEKLEQQINTGAKEYEELRRSVDASTEGTPYERALAKAIGALISLTLEAKKLTLVETQNRGRGDIEALWQQMQLIRHALYQEDFVFIDEMNAEKTGISEMAMQVLAKDDDFGDEDEK